MIRSVVHTQPGPETFRVLTVLQILKMPICFLSAHLFVGNCLVKPLRGVPNADVLNHVFEFGRSLCRPQSLSLRCGHPTRTNHLVKLFKYSILSHDLLISLRSPYLTNYLRGVW